MTNNKEVKCFVSNIRRPHPADNSSKICRYGFYACSLHNIRFLSLCHATKQFNVIYDWTWCSRNCQTFQKFSPFVYPIGRVSETLLLAFCETIKVGEMFGAFCTMYDIVVRQLSEQTNTISLRLWITMLDSFGPERLPARAMEHHLVSRWSSMFSHVCRPFSTFAFFSCDVRFINNK